MITWKIALVKSHVVKLINSQSRSWESGVEPSHCAIWPWPWTIEKLTSPSYRYGRYPVPYCIAFIGTGTVTGIDSGNLMRFIIFNIFDSTVPVYLNFWKSKVWFDIWLKLIQIRIRIGRFLNADPILAKWCRSDQIWIRIHSIAINVSWSRKVPVVSPCRGRQYWCFGSGSVIHWQY